jgi:hypothetical protein
MSRQFFPMGVGMGIMPWNKHRFFLWMVREVRVEVINRVVFCILLVTCLVLAGM